jgi:hypothetical protein
VLGDGIRALWPVRRLNAFLSFLVTPKAVA